MKRLLHIIGWLLVGISLLLGGIFIYLQSPIGQDFLTKEIVSYLRKKLNTKVEVEKVKFDIPDWLLIENVYIEDQNKDTLILGKSLHIDIDMYIYII